MPNQDGPPATNSSTYSIKQGSRSSKNLDFSPKTSKPDSIYKELKSS